MNAILALALARLKEPSTWTSIAVAILAMHIPGVDTVFGAAAPYLVAIGAGLGVALPEAKKAA